MSFSTLFIEYFLGLFIIVFILFMIWMILDIKRFNKLRDIVSHIIDSALS